MPTSLCRPVLRLVGGAGIAVLCHAPAVLHAQGAAAATPSALTLEAAVSLAREHNPEIVASRNDPAVARASVRSAYGSFLPTLSAETSLGYTAPGELRFGSETFGEKPAHYSSAYQLTLMQTLSAPKLLRPAMARVQERAAAQKLMEAEAGLASQVGQQYLAALQAQQALAQAEREVVRASRHVRLARSRLQAGSSSGLDVKRAEVQERQAEIQRLRAGTALEIERLTLGRLMGVPLAAGTQLASEPELFEPRWTAEALVQRALQNNPGLQASRMSADVSRTRARSARLAYLPALSLGARVNGSAHRSGIDDQGGFSFDYRRQPLSLSAELSVPIFNGFTREQQLREARAGEEDARAQLRSAEMRLGTDVAAALMNLKGAYEAALLHKRMWETSAEELRLAEERFRLGLAGSLELVDSQTRLGAAEKSQLDSIYQFHKLLVSLEALVGEPLR